MSVVADWAPDGWVEFVWVGESRFRTEETRESAQQRGNCYGLVLADYGDKQFPVICGHGGSMWLCPECAENLASRRGVPPGKTPA